MFSRKRCQKENITFHPNYTVSYREYRTYYFEPSMSVGNESDLVTVPNMLVLVRPGRPLDVSQIFAVGSSRSAVFCRVPP